MLVEEKRKMKLILPEDDWDSAEMLTLEEIKPSMREDISFIMLDNCDKMPAVLEVTINIFKNRRTISFAEESLERLNELLAVIEVRSNEELMEAIRQSRIDKREGNLRKFDDIVRECGLE